MEYLKLEEITLGWKYAFIWCDFRANCRYKLLYKIIACDMNYMISLSHVSMGKEAHVLPEAVILCSRAMVIVVNVVMFKSPNRGGSNQSAEIWMPSYVLCYPCRSLVGNKHFRPKLVGIWMWLNGLCLMGNSRPLELMCLLGNIWWVTDSLSVVGTIWMSCGWSTRMCLLSLYCHILFVGHQLIFPKLKLD